MSAHTKLAKEVYNDLQNEEYAIPATLRKTTQGVPDYTTGLTTPVTEDLSCVILFLDPTNSEAVPDSFEIRSGDLVILFSGNGVQPTTEHTILINGTGYTIKRVVDIAVGAKALFTILIR